MTDFTQQVVFVGKNNFQYIELCSMMCVCVCVPTNKYANIVIKQGLREIFVLEGEGVAGGGTELQNEELHELYWELNVVGGELKASGADGQDKLSVGGW
jgi:hypothetical protein